MNRGNRALRVRHRVLQAPVIRYVNRRTGQASHAHLGSAHRRQPLLRSDHRNRHGPGGGRGGRAVRIDRPRLPSRPYGDHRHASAPGDAGQPASPDPFDSDPQWLEGARQALDQARTGQTSGPFPDKDQMFNHLTLDHLDEASGPQVPAPDRPTTDPADPRSARPTEPPLPPLERQPTAGREATGTSHPSTKETARAQTERKQSNPAARLQEQTTPRPRPPATLNTSRPRPMPPPKPRTTPSASTNTTTPTRRHQTSRNPACRSLALAPPPGALGRTLSETCTPRSPPRRTCPPQRPRPDPHPETPPPPL